MRELLFRRREIVEEVSQPKVIIDKALNRLDFPYTLIVDSEKIGLLLKEYTMSDKNIKKLTVYFGKKELNTTKPAPGNYNYFFRTIEISVGSVLDMVENRREEINANPAITFEETVSYSLNGILQHELSHYLFDELPKQKQGYSFGVASNDIYDSVQRELPDDISGSISEYDYEEAKARGLHAVMERSGCWQGLVKIETK